MHNASDVSALLFSRLCHDLDLIDCLESNRFDPFPNGLPAESELDTTGYAKRALLCSVFKKSEVESAPDAEDLTMASFIEANNFCKTQTVEAFRNWDGQPSIGYSIATARQLLYQWFSSKRTVEEAAITMTDIESSARFGPGASVGMKGKPTTLYFKCGDAPMTAGSDFVRSWYESSVAQNPLCEAAEMARKARQGAILVQSNGNLAFVPKSYSARRIVITEASLNTYFQLGLGEEMQRVLREHTGISFSTQPDLNVELARQGSIDGTYATMDLKQCSDYISRALVEFMFPPVIVRWFNKLRTNCVTTANGEQIELFMCSTMGNGFTFPLQTILLVACVLGVYDTLGIPVATQNGRNYGVFGDDIVVTADAYHLLSSVLQALGLRVNQAKSFNEGSFRESCGADFLNGTNVRGVYLKRYQTDTDLLSCFNRLILWSTTHGIVLTSTLAVILSLIEGPIPMVPPDEPVTAGIIMPFPPFNAGREGLWEYYPYRPLPNSITFEPWEQWDMSGRPDDSKARSKKLRRWIGDLRRYCDGSINEPAALKVLLAGGIRRFKMFIRNTDKLKYRQIVVKTPRWGYTPLEAFPKNGSGDAALLDSLISDAFASFYNSLMTV